MDFPEYDARTFRTSLHKLFANNGYIDTEKAAQWLDITPRTLKNWISGKTRTPQAVWCLVYLCSTGDLAVFNRKWFGWHIDGDTIGTQTRRYTCAQVESLEWFKAANARLIQTTRHLENEVAALPYGEKKVLQDVYGAKKEISESLERLEKKLTMERFSGLSAKKTAEA